MNDRAYTMIPLVILIVACLSAQAGELPLQDRPAPNFELPSLSGETVSLEDLRGKIVVLHFGAGW